MTPEQQRLRYHADASPVSALTRLRAALTSGSDAERAFYEWLAAPMTQLMTQAVEELADNPPLARTDTKETLLVQYGVTSGLQMAAKLLTNPRRIFPELFRDPGNVNPEGPLDGSYRENADTVIDNM